MHVGDRSIPWVHHRNFHCASSFFEGRPRIKEKPFLSMMICTHIMLRYWSYINIFIFAFYNFLFNYIYFKSKLNFISSTLLNNIDINFAKQTISWQLLVNNAINNMLIIRIVESMKAKGQRNATSSANRAKLVLLRHRSKKTRACCKLVNNDWLVTNYYNTRNRK